MWRYLLSIIGLWLPSVGMTQAMPTLTIYTYNSFVSEWGPGPELQKQFETQCQCHIEFVGMVDSIVMLNRLKMEGQRTSADVVIGLDDSLLAIAEHDQLVLPHTLTPPESRTLDWWHPHFLPYDYGYFAFIYRRDRITTPPHQLSELIQHDSWRIVYSDPRTSTPGLGLLLWMHKIFDDDEIVTAWQQLAQRTVTITKSWSEAYGLFKQGEADFVLSYTTSPAAHRQFENDDRYQAAQFDEGHYRQIEVAAIVNSQKNQNEAHRALAIQFLSFLLSPEAQRILMTHNIMYPVMEIELPPSFDDLPSIDHALFYTPSEVQQHQKEWIKQWQRALM